MRLRPITTAALASIAAVLAVGLAAPGLAGRIAVAEWGQALAEAAGAAACAAAAAHTRGRARLVWSLFAAGLGIWAVTDAALALTTLVGVEVPEVSAFDAGWLAFYVPMLWAVLILYGRMRPERGWQGVLDALLVTLAIAVIAWTTVVGPSAHDAPGGLLGTLVGGLYPALDLTCLAALGWVVLRHRQRSPAWLRWVVLALALQASAGLAYLLSALHGQDVALTAAVAYMAAGWAWVCAGASRCRAPQRSWAAGAHDRPPAWSETVPFALGLFVILLAAALPDPELRVAGAGAGALMAVRAIAALRVNRELIAERDRLLVTDPLTGAYNRRFLQTEAARAFARSLRGEESLSAIAFDLDHFKEVNDRLGHGAGDQVLQAVCAAVSAHLRVGDLLCRMGGDEFLVLCPATRGDDAAGVGERLREAVGAAARRVVPEVPVTASVGVATLPDDARTPEELLRHADSALYAAKDAGRDRVVAFAGRVMVA